MINSGQNDVAIIMNLQLALKISQEEIYQMKFQHIYKEGNNCIITLNNKKELVLNNEHLLPELQLIFKVNIGSNIYVIGGKVSNKRNRIIEAFNQTRKFKLNHLGNSENDKQYQKFYIKKFKQIQDDGQVQFKNFYLIGQFFVKSLIAKEGQKGREVAQT
ncbi:unnamed protein product [Paramecium pentaurelia]|uniref:Uncharacterized protein n=1 Tax=Paramecium pentaurelia TaxID=43138 RepID=A0A8S1V000_9CILI|nr:unnamed protein product [Paramecium pentaurelia]CAD8203031.1 unnamed protein product [Paramecium pentaurelia]